ncbi:CinA family protein [Legionella fallonii]|uniref:Competence-damage inducible protein CinA n=1 Tax=Legionella fallonii LLAP-10 TaxID=1212491 RepID=A0A098G5T8_9GAMM|nr:CinA family protein [Legionella fallonii]CEG57336.1 Competence-damage inducible protein CinA [Legionella fallonii LLAP-10]
MSQFAGIIQEIASLLKRRNWQLVTAESCTGGLIASYLTEIPGSSNWFERGFVTYSNLAKQDMLGVPKELIDQFGAVSEEVAQAMAIGAIQHSAGDIAVSVTGIAGPDGGTIEKPVGTVCLSWATREGLPLTVKRQFHGTRQDIRIASCQEALHGLLNKIQLISN